MIYELVVGPDQFVAVVSGNPAVKKELVKPPMGRYITSPSNLKKNLQL